MKRKCLECDTYFEIPTAPTRRDRKKFCSRECCNKGNWKLGIEERANKQRGKGSKDTYTKYMGRHEHRVVMEQKIGRSLLGTEIVHHVDGNKKNNHPDNLVITSRQEHSREHSTKNRKCSSEGCERKHIAKGLCGLHYRNKFYFKRKRIL
jgi:hypothetical protein